MVMTDEERRAETRERHKRWQREHREQCHENARRYRQTHKTEEAERARRYVALNKERVAKRRKHYNQEHKEECRTRTRQWLKTPKGRACKARRDAKRRHNLGFLPLNAPFEGAHAHHIDKDRVIYIPAETHRSVPHCLATGKGMDEMNKLALAYMQG